MSKRIELTDLERKQLSSAVKFANSSPLGWRPIETAPKDGTNVLIYGNWTADLKSPTIEEKEIFIAHWSYDEWYIEGTELYAPTVSHATHWMPLPDPPIEE